MSPPGGRLRVNICLPLGLLAREAALSGSGLSRPGFRLSRSPASRSATSGYRLRCSPRLSWSSPGAVSGCSKYPCALLIWWVPSCRPVPVVMVAAEATYCLFCSPPRCVPSRRWFESRFRHVHPSAAGQEMIQHRPYLEREYPPVFVQESRSCVRPAEAPVEPARDRSRQLDGGGNESLWCRCSTLGLNHHRVVRWRVTGGSASVPPSAGDAASLRCLIRLLPSIRRNPSSPVSDHHIPPVA